MRSALLFLAGVLVGANLVYFLMVRGPARVTAPATPAAAPVTLPPTGSVALPGAPATVNQQASPPAAPAVVTPPAAAATGVAVPVPSTAPPAISPSGLLLPVAGIRAAQLVDTYTQARSGGRVHDAIDIMAARGTPVLAAIDGKVEKLFTSNLGGLTIYEFDPSSTYVYYYAHLDRYAPGLVEGQALHRGDVIGYVGSTGNASPDAPHLHFAIELLGPEKHWWQATAINPYPLLGGTPH